MKRGNIAGENIRKLRFEAGLTQEELALKSDLSQGYINQLESGKRGFTQSSLEMIASALSTTLEDLFKTDRPHTLEIKEKNEISIKKQIPSKEFLKLLNALPAHIIEHYFILLKMEKKLLDSKRLRSNL